MLSNKFTQKEVLQIKKNLVKHGVEKSTCFLVNKIFMNTINIFCIKKPAPAYKNTNLLDLLITCIL